jgi:hypothetical protein
MSNEWLEIAWINFTKAILHGQVVDGTTERQVDLILPAEQVERIQDLNAKHEAEMFKLLRSFLA